MSIALALAMACLASLAPASTMVMPGCKRRSSAGLIVERVASFFLCYWAMFRGMSALWVIELTGVAVAMVIPLEVAALEVFAGQQTSFHRAVGDDSQMVLQGKGTSSCSILRFSML